MNTISHQFCVVTSIHSEFAVALFMILQWVYYPSFSTNILTNYIYVFSTHEFPVLSRKLLLIKLAFHIQFKAGALDRNLGAIFQKGKGNACDRRKNVGGSHRKCTRWAAMLSALWKILYIWFVFGSRGPISEGFSIQYDFVWHEIMQTMFAR